MSGLCIEESKSLGFCSVRLWYKSVLGYIFLLFPRVMRAFMLKIQRCSIYRVKKRLSVSVTHVEDKIFLLNVKIRMHR